MANCTESFKTTDMSKTTDGRNILV